MTRRFIVTDGSDSAHCCFHASVMDTSVKRPSGYFECVCECFDEDHANLIAQLLNEHHEDDQ